MLQDFLVYKERNDKLIEEREILHQNWIECERALALKTPVREAEFALDDSSALELYDCLLPLIKEHRRFEIPRNNKKFSRIDYVAI